MLLNCKKHGLTEHSISKSNKKRCRKCMVEAVTKRRYKVKEMATKYKGGECMICGYNKYIGALEFHHLNSNEKEFHIAKCGHSRSWDRVKQEIDKCILVCSNCHREIHAGLIQLTNNNN